MKLPKATHTTTHPHSLGLARDGIGELEIRLRQEKGSSFELGWATDDPNATRTGKLVVYIKGGPKEFGLSRRGGKQCLQDVETLFD